MNSYMKDQAFTHSRIVIVTAGQAILWFGQYGEGIQYVLPQTIQELINSGILFRF